MEYDRGDSFPYNLEQNGIRFGSNLKGKLSQRSYSNQFERKSNTSFLSANGCKTASDATTISGDQSRAPWNPPPYSTRYSTEVFKRVNKLGPQSLWWSFKQRTKPDDINPFLPTVAFSQHLLSERLTSLGIMGEPRVPPLNPSETIVFWEHYRLWEV